MQAQPFGPGPYRWTEPLVKLGPSSPTQRFGSRSRGVSPGNPKFTYFRVLYNTIERAA
jgi:hypothetical protein